MPAERAGKPGSEIKKQSLLADDKRLVRIAVLVGFGVLLLLGIAAAILEQVAPRGGRKNQEPELFGASLWEIKPQPNQIVLGFFEDSNGNSRFDYQEKPFDKVSVAIRRLGETEPFRRVAAGVDGLVKIDDLSAGDYEVNWDNYARPEAEAEWQWFEEYQHNREFLPIDWRKISLTAEGHKELVGMTVYRPPLVLILATGSGVSWYDPERARELGRSRSGLARPAVRGRDVYYLEAGKLKKLDWRYRTVSEELVWLEEAEAGEWRLSPQGKTVAYLADGRLFWRSQLEDCREGSLFWEGVRPEVKKVDFFDEAGFLATGRIDRDSPWQIFKLDCNRAEALKTLAEPVNAGALTGGSWFYSSAEATFLVDDSGRSVRYAALGGGGGISVSADGRYLLKPPASGSWLVVDYPAVRESGVEKHYLLTGIAGEPTVIGDGVYFVKAKTCEADGDCGEVVRIRLEGSGVWSVADAWDLKNVSATKVLGVVN